MWFDVYKSASDGTPARPLTIFLPVASERFSNPLMGVARSSTNASSSELGAIAQPR
jgi:hypothetical protein